MVETGPDGGVIVVVVVVVVFSAGRCVYLSPKALRFVLKVCICAHYWTGFRAGPGGSFSLTSVESRRDVPGTRSVDTAAVRGVSPPWARLRVGWASVSPRFIGRGECPSSRWRRFDVCRTEL